MRVLWNTKGRPGSRGQATLRQLFICNLQVLPSLTLVIEQIVAMPYNLLLHKHTRDTVGLKLKGNIVLVDEAHNLLDTIAAIHSAEVKASEVGPTSWGPFATAVRPGWLT